jgi:hypothetical protein
MVCSALPVIAAIGFNVETVTYKQIKFQVWDLGGQTSIRPYWRCYYPNTQVGAASLVRGQTPGMRLGCLEPVVNEAVECRNRQVVHAWREDGDGGV